MSYVSRFFPPYYKYAVFLFIGFQFLYCAFVLAISEAYYKSATLILPIAYRMFDDTVNKNVPGFHWTQEEKHELEMYKHKMMTLWVTSTIGVLLSMVITIPQFFDFNDKRGNRSHLCLVHRRLAWLMFFIMASFVLAMFLALVWAWLGAGTAVRSFHEHFALAEKEEQFLTELEETLDCTNDDDKEVPDEHRCWQNVNIGFINDFWLDLLFYVYTVGNILVLIAIPFFNKCQFVLML
ncbi:unnamed protein product [Angiostrongylus costaricensis]|uniref:Uncharacterized protein n=1 Tax=Angiostrongylus costaricensis TaxID=334426 RepID=A0A0R3PCG8_ANGCS|nr:unnamed protein product [Angiostrongylus costaricensis]